MISFAWPWAFLLLPLPWLVLKFMPGKPQAEAALYMPLIASRQLAPSTHNKQAFNKATLVLLLLIWLALICAVAKPMRVGDVVDIPATGRDVMIAVDISGSMQIEDMRLNQKRVNRLVLIKHVLGEFIKKRQGDRLGLILFGTNAYIQAPLTFDLATVDKLLEETEIGFAGEQTSIGEAIGLTIKRLANNPADSRVLILMTDGQNTAGEVEPLQAAQLAKKEHVIIYTIGIGSDQPMSRGFFGGMVNPSADLDEKTLQQIANITDGQYFRGRNQQELDNIYTTIDQLEEIEHEKEHIRPQQSLFQWPLGVMMALTVMLAISKRHALVPGMREPI